MNKSVEELKWRSISESIKWVATSLAIIGVAYLTKEPKCLWAFLIPAMCSTM